MSELNLILFGPPGAGKGTQAERLRKDFQVPYVATGEMLRAHVKDGTELGRAAKRYMDAGDLVPDELILAMVSDRLKQADAQDGFLLDGWWPAAKALRRRPRSDAGDDHLWSTGSAARAVCIASWCRIHIVIAPKSLEKMWNLCSSCLAPPRSDANRSCTVKESGR